MTQDYPIAPAPAERTGTLLDAAITRDMGGYRPVLETEALYPSYNCLKFDATTTGWCGPSDTAKEFDGVDWTYGWRFVTYGGLNCKAIGFDSGEAEGKVREAFLAGESTGVEREFMRTAFAAGPDNPDDPGNPLWPAAVDITPGGTAVKPSVGLALLEGFISDAYAGQPTLHLPRSVASGIAAVGGLVTDGNTLATKLGSKVAAGVGYDYPNLSPTGVASTGTTRWLYATGQVLVMQGDLISRTVTDPSSNEVYILTERPYFGAFDCSVAAIKVDLNS